LTGWGYQDCPDLKLSNRPVRTRMPGGVAGVQPIMAAPYADACDPRPVTLDAVAPPRLTYAQRHAQTPAYF
jgi:hypothetical protein